MSPHPLDNRWLERLCKEYPQSADQLTALSDHLFTKQSHLQRFILFCAAHPELPMMQMFAEYNAALDDVALRRMREPSNDKLASFRAEAKPGSKRHKTRSKLVEAALRLILEQTSWKLEELADTAGLSIATLHRHFDSRSAVVVAAYDRLFSIE